jgi:F-type H+-transporting ATPase subunit gamma
MQKTNEIRRHIQAVEETRKITNAMYLVSSARTKKVFSKMEYNRRFLNQVESTIKDLLISPHLSGHRYLSKHDHVKRSYLIISGDKGLAGAYNFNLLNLAYAEIQKKLRDGATNRESMRLHVVGMMGASFFAARGLPPDVFYGGATQDPSLMHARRIAQDLQMDFDAGRTEQVFMAYTPFEGSTAGQARMRRILPVRLSDFQQVEGTEAAHTIEYLPSEDEVFELLIPQYLVAYIFGALMHAYASEHASRMNAMQSSTRNADEMLRKLRLQYNLARQSAVTQEIAEITAGMFV